jgi:hypothetical protein
MMKKSFFQFIVIFLATFLLTSSKSVAKDLPLGPVSFDKTQDHWTWRSLNYDDGLLCKKEEVRYPLISLLKPTNACTHDHWSENEYSLLTENLIERDISSIN